MGCQVFVHLDSHSEEMFPSYILLDSLFCLVACHPRHREAARPSGPTSHDGPGHDRGNLPQRNASPSTQSPSQSIRDLQGLPEPGHNGPSRAGRGCPPLALSVCKASRSLASARPAVVVRLGLGGSDAFLCVTVIKSNVYLMFGQRSRG